MTSDMTCSCGQDGIAAEVLVAANEIRQGGGAGTWPGVRPLGKPRPDCRLKPRYSTAARMTGPGQSRRTANNGTWLEHADIGPGPREPRVTRVTAGCWKQKKPSNQLEVR